MASARITLTSEEKAFLKSWDAEIETEEAERRELTKQARLEEEAFNSANRTASAQVSRALLQAAGLTETQARTLADAEFERARKLGAAQRKRALAILKKRIRANTAEIKNVIVRIKRG